MRCHRNATFEQRSCAPFARKKTLAPAPARTSEHPLRSVQNKRHKIRELHSSSESPHWAALGLEERRP